MKTNARIYFSFRSPFSWLALVRLRQLIPGLTERMEIIPYWEPDAITAAALQLKGAAILYAPMSKAKHLYILQDTKRLAKKLGLRMAWPIDDRPCWEIPHLAWLQAHREGKAEELYDALVEARWERGENICDVEVVRRAANGLGLDGEFYARATDDPSLREEGVECLTNAFNNDVFGVPYFQLRQQRYWGLDRVEDFASAYLSANGSAAGLGAVPTAETVMPTMPSGYDHDLPGGCG